MAQIGIPHLVAPISLQFNELLTVNLCSVAATALLFYDYFLTLSDEIRCIWRSQFSGATVLFLINRYATFSYRVFMIVQFALRHVKNEALSDKTCSSILQFNECLIVLLELTATVFMALRLYAIWSTSRKILIFILCIGLVEPVCNIYYFSSTTILAAPFPIIGCMQIVNLSNGQASFLRRFGPIFAICAHAVVLLLTWIKTAGIVRLLTALKVKTSLWALLLRDGGTYFFLLFTLDVFVAIQSPRLKGVVPAVADVAASILISHFILNLRKVYIRGQEGTLRETEFSTVRFVRTITGNLGAPLDVNSGEGELEGWNDTEIYSTEPILVGLPRSSFEELPTMSSSMLSITTTATVGAPHN